MTLLWWAVTLWSEDWTGKITVILYSFSNQMFKIQDVPACPVLKASSLKQIYYILMMIVTST